MKFIPEPNADTNHTSVRGEIETTYQDIVQAFGNPHHLERFVSTPMEWIFKDDQDNVYTLFFWDTRRPWTQFKGSWSDSRFH